MAKKKVGILALQGDYAAHSSVLAGIGAEPVLVRSETALHEIDGLILPGGESTTMLKLLHRQNLFEPLRRFGWEKPIFGTCAGVILLASQVTNPAQESLNLIDMTVERNGYGRQIDSSVARFAAPPAFGRHNGEPLEAVFIRAPIIRETGGRVQVLAAFGGNPVLVAQDRHLGATFHPELSGDPRVHQLFLSKL